MTARKAKYGKGRKADVMKGAALTPNASVAARYDKKLQALVAQMVNATQKELVALFKEPTAEDYFTGMDASVSSQARILMNALQERFDDLFGLKAKGISETLVDDSDKSSMASLKLSLKEVSAGFTLKRVVLTPELDEIYKAIIADNVGLIKSIPTQYLDDVRGAVMRSITTGNGLQDLVPFIKKHNGMTIKRARLIAHDQTRKAYANINRERLTSLGVKKFEWLHSQGGQEPRKLHKDVLNGNIYSWDDLPIADERTGERCGPGVLINCRCRAIPVVDFTSDDWN